VHRRSLAGLGASMVEQKKKIHPYLDYGGALSHPGFPSAVRARAASCKPLCPPPRPVPRRYDAHQSNHKGKKSEQEKEPKNARPASFPSYANAVKEGVGRNSGSSPPAPSSSAFALLSSFRSLRSLRSHSDTSLPASPSDGASLLKSVVERKSSPAWLHLPLARRSWILHRLFLLLLSSHNYAYRIFCWAFHLGHTLKR